MNDDDKPPANDIQDWIQDAIREFPFWDYGLDVVDPTDENAEWVPDLAKAVIEAIADRAAGIPRRPKGESQ